MRLDFDRRTKEEIARRCGYPDEYRFSAEFERREGLGPLSWRAQFPDPYG